MDIVEWREDPAEYIANALNPAKVLDVRFDDENEHACTVVVPDDIDDEDQLMSDSSSNMIEEE